jgi:hypothetical protein
MAGAVGLDQRLIAIGHLLVSRADLGVGRACGSGAFLRRPPDVIGKIVSHTRHPPMTDSPFTTNCVGDELNRVCRAIFG